MSERNKKGISPGWATVLISLGLIDLGLFIRHTLLGKNVTLFNPQGLMSHDEHNLFVWIVILLLAAAVPVVIFLYFVAWKFRESNTKAVHTPNASGTKRSVFITWAYPLVFFVLFVSILWPTTFKIQPHKAIADAQEPVLIQVIALRWKWVFLYPDQGVATVNYVQVPVDRPVTFALTADDAPMSSFWIPNLGGQLYAMTGHVNQLHLMADKIGNYPGSTAEINGSGFADMTFTTSVGSQADFDNWVKGAKQDNNTLNAAAYADLLKPSEDNAPALYSSYQPNLYDTVVMKYMSGMGHSH
jgi:cytochrome o ubiquinol oxidase subunit 2